MGFPKNITDCRCALSTVLSRRFGDGFLGHGQASVHVVDRIIVASNGGGQSELRDPDFLHIGGQGAELPDGTCIRDYVHVDDLAQAHLLALQKLAPGKCLLFNLGTGRGYSVRQVTDSCRKATGHAIPENLGPRRPGDPPELVADSSRAQKQLGWIPRYPDIESIVATAWKWHQSHPRGYDDTGK